MQVMPKILERLVRWVRHRVQQRVKAGSVAVEHRKFIDYFNISIKIIFYFLFLLNVANIAFINKISRKIAMLDFLKTTRRALPLALALMGAAASAQSVSVSVYVTDTRLLTIPAVNVPGEGSYNAQLMLEGEDSGLRIGSILKVTQLISADKAFKLPVAYLFNEPLIAIPALAVKTPDGRVSYFDVTLRNISNGDPMKFIVTSMVDTTGGQSGAKGATGPEGPAGARGLAGPAGSTGPAGSIGPAGSMGATGSTGPTGLQGVAGTAGVDGKTVLNGAVDPVAGDGNNGDFYLNTATSTIFGPKVAGAWPAGVLLKGAAGTAGAAGAAGATGLAGATGSAGPAGPAGSIGATGSTGAAGSTGPTGLQGVAGTAGVDGKTVLNGAVDPVAGDGNNGDFYLNTATSTIFGPKVAGAWPAGVLLKGAAGAAGAAGSAGPAGSIGATGSTGPAGTAGSPGIAGAVGPAGPTGATGAVGATGPAGPGGNATGSSAHVVAVTTVLGGLVGTVGVLPLYGYNQVAPTLVGLTGVAAITVLDEPFSMAQPFKSGATLTKIQAVIGSKVALALIGSTGTVTATLYKIPLSGSPVSTGLSCDLGPAFTGILAVGTKASCTGSGSVSVNAGDRGLIVFSAQASGLSLVNAFTISAAASVE